MSSTPADVPDELRHELLRHFTKGQLAELTAAIAWENHRARLNRALGVRAAGFSDGAFCVLPEHR
jgi:alkylhydroperoxidase family enzyme